MRHACRKVKNNIFVESSGRVETDNPLETVEVYSPMALFLLKLYSPNHISHYKRIQIFENSQLTNVQGQMVHVTPFIRKKLTKFLWFGDKISDEY